MRTGGHLRLSLAALLVLAAFVVRAALPMGWMPMQTQDGIKVLLCSGDGSTGRTIELTLPKTRSDGRGSNPSQDDLPRDPCPFGVSFAQAFDLPAPIALPAMPVAYQDEGRIEGHYNGPHGHASPPDRQENYGGQVIQAGLGANVVIGGNLRIGAEATVPLYQDLNGIQSPRKFGVNLNLSRMF
jgi:hypothetical protein